MRLTDAWVDRTTTGNATRERELVLHLCFRSEDGLREHTMRRHLDPGTGIHKMQDILKELAGVLQTVENWLET